MFILLCSVFLTMARGSSHPINYNLTCALMKAEGADFNACAEAFGVTPATLKKWLKKDNLAWDDLTITPENIDDPNNWETIAEPDPIPDSFVKMIQLMDYAKAAGHDISLAETIQYMKATGTIKQERPKIFKYKRPNWFVPKQTEIVDTIQRKSAAVEGPRQVGKTIAIFAGICERMILSQSDWTFVASNERTAEALLRKLVNDPLLQYLKPHYAVHPTGTYFTVYNREGATSEFRICSTTVAGVRGQTRNVWIDELDIIVETTETKEVVPAAIALIRSNPNLICVFSMNLGSGIYIMLKKVLEKPQYQSIITMMTLLKDDSFLKNIVGQEQKDEFIMDVQTVIAGPDYAKRQMLNETTLSGHAFDGQSVTEAYDMYKVYLDELPLPLIRVFSLDPSGTGHPFGWCCLGLDLNRMEVVEIESGMMQMGLDNKGNKWTPQQINAFIKKKVLELRPQVFITESNSGGAIYYHLIKPLGVRCYLQNFGAKASITSRENHVKIANWFVNEGRAFIKNEDLVNQLILYDPNRDKEQHKGDIADAFIHAVWRLVGGYKFMKIIIKNALEEFIAPRPDEVIA